MSEYLEKGTNYIYKSLHFSSLCLRQIFSTASFYILVLIFNFVSLILWSIFIPYKYSGGIGLIYSTIIPTLLVLGWVGYVFRKSTLFNTLSTFGTNKNQFYIGQIFVSIVVTFFLAIIFLLVIIIFGNLNFFLENWIWDGADRITGHVIKYWFTILNFTYIMIISCFSSFAMYFLLHSWTNTIKSYYIVILIISILSIIFGAALNSYFDTAEHSTIGNIEYIPSFDPNMYPAFMFWPSLLFPYFGLAQMFDYGVAMLGAGGNRHIIDGMHDSFFVLGFDKERIKWTLTFLQPFAFIFIAFFIGKIRTRIR